MGAGAANMRMHARVCTGWPANDVKSPGSIAPGTRSRLQDKGGKWEKKWERELKLEKRKE